MHTGKKSSLRLWGIRTIHWPSTDIDEIVELAHRDRRISGYGGWRFIGLNGVTVKRFEWRRVRGNSYSLRCSGWKSSNSNKFQ